MVINRKLLKKKLHKQIHTNTFLPFIKNQPHVLVTLIILIAGVIYATIIPPLWGLDEVAHTNRAYEIANGQVLPTLTSKGDVGSDIPSTLAELEYYVYADLLDDNDNVPLAMRTDTSNAAIYAKLTNRKFGEKKEPTMITAAYSPVAYPGPVIGFMTGKAFDLSLQQTLWLARVLALLSFALTVFFTLYILRNRRIVWLVAVIALLPTTISQASVISADTLINGLGLLLFSIVYTAITRGTNEKSSQRRLSNTIWVALAIAAVLPLIKPNNIFLSMMVLALPLSNYMSRLKANALKAFSILLAIGSALLWTKISSLPAAPRSLRADQVLSNPMEQMLFIVHHPISFAVTIVRTFVSYGDAYINTTIGTIGWNLSPLPLIFTVAIILLSLLCILYAQDEIKTVRVRNRVGMLILSLCGIGSYFFIMYLVFSPVGWKVIDGVNGRYLIPFIPLLAVATAHLIPKMRIDSRMLVKAAPITMSICLIASVITYIIVTY